MKHAMSAVVALALGIGLATAAQATGTQRQSALANGHTQARLTTTNIHGIAPSKMRHARIARQTTSRQQIKEVQQALKQDGLYKGRVSGVMNRPTRLALSRFEKQNGLPQSSRINKPLLARLNGNQNIGVGSSTPHNGNQNSAGNPTITPTVPPATQTPSAGGNTPNTPSTTNQTQNK